MDGINSTQHFNSEAYKYCTNITSGWHRGLGHLGFNQRELEKRILDVGCGYQGSALVEGPHIFGIDPNLGVLRFFGTGEIKATVRPDVPERSLRALAEQLPFRDESFDFAYSTKAVGWYPNHINLEMALSEMLRVIKKRTGVVIFDMGQDMKSEIINPVLQRYHRDGFSVMPNRGWIYITHPEFTPELIN